MDLKHYLGVVHMSDSWLDNLLCVLQGCFCLWCVTNPPLGWCRPWHYVGVSWVWKFCSSGCLRSYHPIKIGFLLSSKNLFADRYYFHESSFLYLNVCRTFLWLKSYGFWTLEKCWNLNCHQKYWTLTKIMDFGYSEFYLSGRHFHSYFGN